MIIILRGIIIQLLLIATVSDAQVSRVSKNTEAALDGKTNQKIFEIVELLYKKTQIHEQIRYYETLIEDSKAKKDEGFQAGIIMAQYSYFSMFLMTLEGDKTISKAERDELRNKYIKEEEIKLKEAAELYQNAGDYEGVSQVYYMMAEREMAGINYTRALEYIDKAIETYRKRTTNNELGMGVAERVLYGNVEDRYRRLQKGIREAIHDQKRGK